MRRILFAAMLVGLAACSSEPTGPTITNYTGTYSFAGTVNGQPAEDLSGTIALTNQSGQTVAVTLNMALRQNGTPEFTFVTQSPGTSTIGADGSIVMTQAGPLTIGTATFSYNLRLDGVLNSSGHMTGNWTLTTTFPSSDAGAFSAQKQ